MAITDIIKILNILLKHNSNAMNELSFLMFCFFRHITTFELLYISTTNYDQMKPLFLTMSIYSVT